jgi:hypothetical protein
MASTSPIIYTTYGAKHANTPHTKSNGVMTNQPKNQEELLIAFQGFLPHPIMQRVQIALAQGAK